MTLLKAGQCSYYELALIGDLERPMEPGDYLRKLAQKYPKDRVVQLGLAAQAAEDGQPLAAIPILRELISRFPEWDACHSILGRLLVDDSIEEFATWHRNLPTSANELPNIWFVRGLFAQKHGQLPIAARCFLEVLRIIPAHKQANYQLGLTLSAIDDSTSELFAARAKKFFELTSLLDQILKTQGQVETPLRKTASICIQTGRIWEALAWSAVASENFPQSQWPQTNMEFCRQQLDEHTPQTIPAARIATDLSLAVDSRSALKYFDELSNSVTTDAKSSIAARIRFIDDGSHNVNFVYENGHDPETPGVRMLEQTGGGVAILDINLDGWPDLYLTQGSAWESGADHPTPTPELSDRLYLNNKGKTYIDVTRQANIDSQGFGQGCTVGDINGDGFDDLYIANIGRNELYLNNGDGTFTAKTDSASLAFNDWTTSCLAVDLNADGLPDLYDVNYVSGSDVHQAICGGYACSPKNFDGTPNRLLINQGDGTFRHHDSITAENDSKGLGIVAAGLSQRNRPCLFVANDQVPNYFLDNRPADNSYNIELENSAFLNGLAYNVDGLPMACMGIAADDANGDGRIDFFVTNFADEANTLYLQDANGLFLDATKSAGVYKDSYPYVGWGTQFLDADLDGDADIVLANGHVDDYARKGGEYQMRAQFYRNDDGRFLELSGDQAGPFFNKKRLSRSLARLDWNNDGRPDFIVSNIRERVSIVTNVSEDVGHYFGITLAARDTARDAIGAEVTVHTGQQSWTKQLTAGDGYQASNQRRLIFGVGDAQTIDEVTVNWPSGSRTVGKSIPADARLMIVEGSQFGTIWRDETPKQQAVTWSPDE